MNWLVARSVVVLAVLGAVVLAAESKRTRTLFDRFDKDGDGKLSESELTAPRLFKRFDADADGVLTAKELSTLGERRALRGRSESALVNQVVEHQMTLDGRERSYFVFTPSTLSERSPVVFVFHGGGGKARGFARRRGLNEFAEKEGFLVVYPQGYGGNWNDGREAPAINAQREKVDDVKFVRSIVAELAKSHPIDRSRIYATGISNGGIFSHYLAANASDLFAAIAPIIGGLAEPVADDFSPSHPISVLIIQGDSDGLVPIDGGAVGGRLLARRGRVISTDETIKKYLEANDIDGEPTVTTIEESQPDDGTTTEVRRYPLGNDDVRVEVYVVKNGGHTIPGTDPPALLGRIVGKTSRDFDAWEVVWDFFKKVPPRKQAD
ncbi:Esterase PHB depolymerase [Planctomycetes bacterium Pan216]|uniref:Esterase PHB depolymerase n=1 Tax=Kolteria novifilia TaxID=2527975 RepID=A0A518B8S2_9BACT|nr:Esterase PHB depolymerase [Planctomycetes bacterium Pan216]